MDRINEEFMTWIRQTVPEIIELYNPKHMKDLYWLKEEYDKGEYTEEVEQVIRSKLIARVNFCTMEPAGQACAEKIKEQFGGEVRGTRLDIKEKPWGPCLVCNESAKAVTYVGRAY